ncbi:MAG TPA: ubiquitin-like small modifier protein 1 [Dehalococcoidia bacterium]|nr:ubiquitin-like small modifier protein 1 [Dehalococcoidia bacterium]
MAVQVRVPTLLQATTQGERVVAAEGATLGDLINNLESRYPGFKEKLTTDDGGLHRFINVYKNDEDVRYLGKLETPVSDGDVISILPAVAGGVV